MSRPKLTRTRLAATVLTHARAPARERNRTGTTIQPYRSTKLEGTRLTARFFHLHSARQPRTERSLRSDRRFVRRGEARRDHRL